MAVFKFIIELLIYVFFAWAMYSLAKGSILCHKNSMKFDGYIWCYVLFLRLYPLLDGESESTRLHILRFSETALCVMVPKNIFGIGWSF